MGITYIIIPTDNPTGTITTGIPMGTRDIATSMARLTLKLPPQSRAFGR